MDVVSFIFFDKAMNGFFLYKDGFSYILDDVMMYVMDMVM